MKGALGMKCLSLKRVIAEGLRGGLLYWDPGRYVKEGPGYGRLSPRGDLLRPRRNWNREGGARILGTLNGE